MATDASRRWEGGGGRDGMHGEKTDAVWNQGMWERWAEKGELMNCEGDYGKEGEDGTLN